VAGTSLLKLAFWHQSVPVAAVSLEGITFTPLELNNEINYFDMMVEIMESEAGLIIRLSYNTNQFKAETITRLLTHYEALLQSVVEQPERRLLDLPILLADAVSQPNPQPARQRDGQATGILAQNGRGRETSTGASLPLKI
jgi:non-ribosomal peptide synthetase component F